MEKKTVDPVTESALEIVESEKQREENVLSAQENREALIAQTYKMIGQIQTAGMFEKIAAGGKIMWIKQVKDSKIYKDISEFGTWQKFCDYVGLSRSKIDEDLQNLDIFGENFFTAQRQLCLDRSSLRKLRNSVSDGEIIIEGEFVQIGEEKIPLKEEYKDDLQAAFEHVFDAKKEVIKEQKATIRAKDKALKAYNKTIDTQAAALSKYEDEAKEKGLAPGEENLLKQIDELKTIFEGFALRIDPDGSPFLVDTTDRVRSAYVGLLAHIKQYSATIHNAVVSEYGFPDEAMTAWSPDSLEIEGAPETLKGGSKMAELGELIKG